MAVQIIMGCGTPGCDERVALRNRWLTGRLEGRCGRCETTWHLTGGRLLTADDAGSR
ncbi:MAG: hypothetical protein OEU32_00645 [Acidimicrobiia bacterium]|nr:hypothetical protein [Acidimicrobiia bacterium]